MPALNIWRNTIQEAVEMLLEQPVNVGQQCFRNILLDIPKTLVGVPPSPGLAAERPVEHA